MVGRTVSLLGTALGLLFGAPVLTASPALAATLSPAQTLAASLAAGRSQTSPHREVTDLAALDLVRSYGCVTAISITDAGRASGILCITITKGGSTGHVTVEVLNGVL